MLKIKIFFGDLNKKKKFFISLKKTKDINSVINDHKPLCIAISNDGMYFISLKKRGWGIPHHADAKQAYKIPLVKIFKLRGFYFNSSAT